MLTAILALLLFTVLIFPHELGHFLMARATGVQVNEFAFGMGPAIWQKQRGETLYSIRAFPIGGYCAMEGEDTESDSERSFASKAAWQKLLVLIAGSAMNVLICVVIVTVIIGISGTATTKIADLNKNQPAYQAGLRAGDKIVAVNSEKIGSWTDLSEAIQKNHDHLEISYIRGGSRDTVSMKAVKNEDRYVIGISPQFDHNPVRAVRNGIITTGTMTKALFSGLKMLITGKAGADDVSGPVGIVSMVHQSASRGAVFFFMLMAFMSLNLAIINMLPFPALDGGRVIFVLIRAVTGNAITDRMEAAVHAIGLMLLLGLILVITWNDIVKLM